jgi:hypothetical protein
MEFFRRDMGDSSFGLVAATPAAAANSVGVSGKTINIECWKHIPETM